MSTVTDIEGDEDVDEDGPRCRRLGPGILTVTDVDGGARTSTVMRTSNDGTLVMTETVVSVLGILPIISFFTINCYLSRAACQQRQQRPPAMAITTAASPPPHPHHHHRVRVPTTASTSPPPQPRHHHSWSLAVEEMGKDGTRGRDRVRKRMEQKDDAAWE